VTFDTTRTAPDCSAPLTVIVLPFMVTVIVGSDELWDTRRAPGDALVASAALPGMARMSPAATAAAPAVMEAMRLKVSLLEV
jgi:hypothetical protein